jgi:hypothetical protein
VTAPAPRDFALLRAVATAVAQYAGRSIEPQDFEVAAWCLCRKPIGPLRQLQPEQLLAPMNGTRVDVRSLIA